MHTKTLPDCLVQIPYFAAGLQHSTLTSLHCVCVIVQGLGTAVLAAILGGLPKTGGSIADHTILFSGA